MDVRARGVKRGGLVCSDELAGHRERYSLSSFPDTAIQFCLLHTLRTLMNLVRAIARHGRQQEGREAMRRERNRKHAPRMRCAARRAYEDAAPHHQRGICRCGAPQF